MCLRLKRFARRPKTEISVYKFYEVDKNTCYDFVNEREYRPLFPQFQMESPYQKQPLRFTYRATVTSDRKRSRLTVSEFINGEVYKGLHVFLSINDAVAESRYFSNGVVVRFRAKPKDFVAYGTFEGNNSAVFNNLTINGIACVSIRDNNKPYDIIRYF